MTRWSNGSGSRTRDRGLGAGRRSDVHPIDEDLGIHPQDCTSWSGAVGPRQHAGGPVPLLLHYHPLVIYRYRSSSRPTSCWRCSCFARRSPTSRSAPTSSTTTLSPRATRRSRPRAGGSPPGGLRRPGAPLLPERAVRRPSQPAGNTPDGVHMASAGGVWSTRVRLRRLPRPRRPVLARPPPPRDMVVADVPPDAARQPGACHAALRRARLRHRGGDAVTLDVRGEAVTVTTGSPATIQLKGQGPRIDGEPEPVSGRRTLKDDDWLAIAADMNSFFSNPGARTVWPLVQNRSNAKFRAHVTSIVGRYAASAGQSSDGKPATVSS